MPGYEAKFKHPLLKRHECPICLFAMRNPVQTECGHLFCQDCLEPVLKRRRPICPLDREEITQEGTFPENAGRREILKLQVLCNYQNCPWVGVLKDLEEHLTTCEYRDVQCTQCGQYIQHRDMEIHQKELCAMRPTTCPHCGKDVPIQQLQTHFEKLCTKIMRSCPNECDLSLQMNLQELEKHIDLCNGTCPLSEVECPFRTYGCTFISLRKNMSTHLEQCNVYHAQIQADSFEEMAQSITKINLSVEHVLERVGGLETQSNALERLQDALEQRIEFLDDRRDRHAHQNVVRIEEQATQNTSTINGDCHAGQHELNQAVQNMTSGYQTHVETNQQSTSSKSSQSSGCPAPLSELALIRKPYEPSDHVAKFLEPPANTGSNTYGTSTQPVTPHYQGFGDSNISPSRVEALRTRVVELEHSVDRALSSCLDQELKIQLLERATYNGVLLWKIDEFDRRRREAVNGVTLSLYSTPFYTSRHGYKMCARIYLNGDGMGKGSHLSFFFVVMRGPFDALLQWPFKQKVTLTLINQNGKKHISDSFRPDPQSSSFQKPGRREMNIASGCPMFVRIDHLLKGGFVKDDAIYVRVVVETMDLP